LSEKKKEYYYKGKEIKAEKKKKEYYYGGKEVKAEKK